MATLYKEVPVFRDYTGIRSDRPHGAEEAGCGYYKIPCPIEQGIGKLSEARSVPTDEFSSQTFSLEEIAAAFSGPNIAIKRTRVPYEGSVVLGLLIKCQMPPEEVLGSMEVNEEENGRLVLRRVDPEES